MALTREQAERLVAAKELELGLTPGLIDSVWDQESNKSLDIGLKGPALSRNRGNAIGPFQIVPFHHPNADLSSFESQLDYSGNLLKDVGVRGYYGRGKAPAGHPTTDQYYSEVMARVGNSAGGAMPAVQTQPSPAVTTAAYKQVQPMNGLLGGGQGQIGGLLGQQMELPERSPGAYWFDVAANIDTMAPGLGGIAKGFSAANKNAFEHDLARTKMGTMSPYQQAQINLQHQQQQYRQQQAAAAQQQAMAQQQQIMQAREIAASQVDDPAQKELIRLGVMDGSLADFGRPAQPADLGDVAGARKEFNAIPSVKNYKGAMSSFNQLGEALTNFENPLNAVSSVFLFMKNLDPTSVVRDSEQGMFLSASGPAARLAGEFNNLLGKGKMTDAARKNIIKSAHDTLRGARKEAAREQDVYTKLAIDQYGADPLYVVGTPFSEPALPEWAVEKTAPEKVMDAGVEPLGKPTAATDDDVDSIFEEMEKRRAARETANRDLSFGGAL